MGKQEIREKTILKMADLAKNRAQEKKRQETIIIEKLLQTKEWQMASSIGLTISQRIEFSTDELLLTALDQGKRSMSLRQCQRNSWYFYHICPLIRS